MDRQLKLWQWIVVLSLPTLVIIGVIGGLIRESSYAQSQIKNQEPNSLVEKTETTQLIPTCLERAESLLGELRTNIRPELEQHKLALANAYISLYQAGKQNCP